MLKEFYETTLKKRPEFRLFVEKFLDEVLPDNVDKKQYVDIGIRYLFYDDKEFLYKLKYLTFRQVNSQYLEKIFNSFISNNSKWVDFLWDSCEDKEKSKQILTTLGNKKLEVIKTITMPSFQSLENDVENSVIITNILNSIVTHMQELQRNQNMMLANISHEMRTPLNSVIGYLDILDTKNDLSTENRKNIIYAKNSSKILLTLINDLLDTQKLSSAKLDLTNNPFWVTKIVKNAVLVSSVNASQKGVEFIYIDKLNVFHEVTGDKDRFLQILNNLFSNAVKFTMPDGKIKVVATSQDLGDRIKVKVKVSDTGIGIPAKKQKELFKPFSRATNREKGTGLGLYISKQLAQKMKGDIWFESEEGKGSTFFVEVEFKKSNKFYDENILKGKKIVILSDKKNSDYCNNLMNQLEDMDVKIKIMHDVNLFIEFLIFNKGIDMAIIIYPNQIEKDDIDKAFIKTCRMVNNNILFIAGIEENYYPENIQIFDKHINTPLNILDIIEIFSAPKQMLKSCRYLVIDDEPSNRLVLSTMIKTFDKLAVVETANDGVAGIEKILNNPPYDIIFLDKRMPKLDGYGVLKKLKELNVEANIYLLTADGDNETILKAKEYNAGYIAKPVSISTLQSIMSNISGGGGGN